MTHYKRISRQGKCGKDGLGGARRLTIGTSLSPRGFETLCSIYNQRLDRQRLSLATYRKCGKTVAVLGMPGQDVGLILFENGFRLANRIELEIEMECVSGIEETPKT